VWVGGEEGRGLAAPIPTIERYDDITYYDTAERTLYVIHSRDWMRELARMVVGDERPDALTSMAIYHTYIIMVSRTAISV